MSTQPEVSSFIPERGRAHCCIAMSLVPLPKTVSHPWSTSVLNAYNQLNAIYQTAAGYVLSDGLEAHRLQQYGRTIATDAYPLLLLMEETREHEGVPHTWINAAADEFTELMGIIDERWRMAVGEYV